VSEDLKSRCVESKSFAMREFNTILGLCRVSRTAQSFLESILKTWTCPDQTWMLGLWWKLSWILDSLGEVSSSATKEAKLVVKMALMFLWSYLSVFPKF